ncbi:hypothetical protein ACAG24_008690 [Mycobacterium sp. pW049]|uniref:hypothetical protein n=1 Tax=[Mycobacterium] bulgaricum TaxID=3238985 RepID=UPI00351B53C7
MTDPAENATSTHRDHRVSRVPQKVTVTSSPLTPIALLLALIAVGLSVWALVSVPEPTPVASTTGAPLSGDSKERVCTTAHVVAMAVQLQTNANVGEDRAAIEAVASNARLAMLGGGDYLLSQISDDTPQELAETARTFGNTLQQLGINALAGVANDEPLQAGRYRDAETARDKLSRLCSN